MKSHAHGSQLSQASIGVRSKVFSVGKVIGKNIWMHKHYENVLPNKTITYAKSKLPPDFEYTIIKYNYQTNDVSFIQSPDFDCHPEPHVGDSIKVYSNGTIRKAAKSKNPNIYHHKWLMVKDDYQGFDVSASIKHSIRWKSLVGHNKEISNKIGKNKYWNQNVVLSLFKPEIIRSGKTALKRTKLSTPTKLLQSLNLIHSRVLHHGCGRAIADSRCIQDLATIYAEYDPIFAPDRSVLDHKYDVVISNYVFNTLSPDIRPYAWRDIANCCDGIAYIAIRCDKIQGVPIWDGVITSKNTFQKQYTAETSIQEAREYFSQVSILVKTNNFIILKATNN